MTPLVKNVSIILTSAGIIVTGIWYYQTKQLEPLAGLIFAIVALIGLLFTKDTKSKDAKGQKFKQKAGDNSEQYQSNRDININK